ncbi:MAG: tetratricopeptide repeat protein [Deltaproteobacteria bacterium]|nr:tetratricopeptide repeat protein [Deltaproteobacteria bacterium]
MTTIKIIFISLVFYSTPVFSRNGTAADLKKAALILYQNKKYNQAAEIFLESFRKKFDARILFNIAQCYRLGNDNDNALKYYKKFLENIGKISFPEGKKENIIKATRKTVIELENKIAAIKHEKEVREKLKREKLNRVKEKELQIKKVAPIMTADDKKNKNTGESVWGRWWFITGSSLAVSFTVAGIFTGIQALNYKNKWETEWKTSDRDNLKLYMNLTDIFIGSALVASAAVITGVILYKKDDSHGSTESSFSITPLFTQNAFSMNLQLKF